MICPRCQSENVQYSTKTTGSNYGKSEGCCGFLLMGPFGLLCGLCGNDVETKEFWICHNCGHKFSHEKALTTMQDARKTAATCNRYKEELKGQPTAYYKSQYENAKNALLYREREYNERFDILVEKHAPINVLVGKYKKKYCKEKRPGCIVMLVLAALGILLCIVGLFPVGLAMAGIAILFGGVSMLRERSMRKKVEAFFLQVDNAFKICRERKEKANSEKKYWEDYADKADFIEKHGQA